MSVRPLYERGEHKRWTDARLVAEYQCAYEEMERKVLAAEIHRRAIRDAQEMAVALGNFLPADPSFRGRR